MINAKLIDKKIKPITDKIEEQLNTFITTCNKLNDSVKERKGVMSSTNAAPKVPLIDRSMNVVITGVMENSNATVWRETITQALNISAGCQIEIIDAFRLGRCADGRARPVLIKLGSVWNRRLVMAGHASCSMLKNCTKFS